MHRDTATKPQIDATRAEVFSTVDNIDWVQLDKLQYPYKFMELLELYVSFKQSPQFRVGDRVQLLCSFNHGAKGTVEFVEPHGAVWVTRDNASSPLRFNKEELKSL